MKTSKIIIICMAAMIPCHVHALSIGITTCSITTCGSTAHMNNDIGYCDDDVTETCYDNNGSIESVSSCNKCLDGYKRMRRTLSLACGIIEYYTCQENCDCTTGEWLTDSAGYDVRNYCNPDTCELSFQYRCAAGYYGMAYASGNGLAARPQGCSQCPEYGNVRGTSPAGSKAITACYIPANTAFTDESGSGVFTGDCHHENDGGGQIGGLVPAN